MSKRAKPYSFKAVRLNSYRFNSSFNTIIGVKNYEGDEVIN
jgi:hypothetical protein